MERECLYTCVCFWLSMCVCIWQKKAFSYKLTTKVYVCVDCVLTTHLIVCVDKWIWEREKKSVCVCMCVYMGNMIMHVDEWLLLGICRLALTCKNCFFFIADIWFPECASGFSTCDGCEWIQGQGQQAGSISLISSNCARMMNVISCMADFKIHSELEHCLSFECTALTVMLLLNAVHAAVVNCSLNLFQKLVFLKIFWIRCT